jgi:hypothetical protein
MFCLERQLLLHALLSSNKLYQVCMSRIDNDNVFQGLKIVFGDNNIHLFQSMVREKVGNLFLYVSSIF